MDEQGIGAAGLDGSDLSFKQPDELRAHPRFPEARRAHVDAFTGFFATEPFLARLLLDSSRMTVSALLVAFHAAYDEGDPSTWPTLGAFQDIVERKQLASRRQVTEILGRFRNTGYARAVQNPADRRTRLIQPTDKLIQCDRVYLCELLRPLNMLYPDRGYAPALAHDAAFHRAFRKAGYLLLQHATSFMERNALIMMLLARHAGYLGLLLVLRAALAGDAEGTSFAALAGRLKVSRTHVRAMFEDVERAGHVSLGGKGGRSITLLPPMWDAFDHFLADHESGNDAVGQFALRLMPAE
jgi:DNA-binding MarR family transcriptional regulator